MVDGNKAIDAAKAALAAAERTQTNQVLLTQIRVLKSTVLNFVYAFEDNLKLGKTLSSECQQYWQSEFGRQMPERLTEFVNQLVEELSEDTSAVC